MNPFLPALLPTLLGFGLDLLLGDPEWRYHPVRLIGSAITGLEARLRRRFPASPEGEGRAGLALAALVPLGTGLAILGLLLLSYGISPRLGLGVEILLCYQLLAAKSLWVESMRVYHRLAAHDLPGARLAVGRIVGRDTAGLDEAGVTRTAVETVAENMADGVIAPLFYLTLGGPALGWWAKAVNTLDSMVGYRNERYLHLGRASALLDDKVNFLPSRLAALCMIAASGPLGLNRKNALRVWRRDRRNHASPNSAQTEAACAGALGIRLAGDAVYFGELHRKPTIGDAARPVEQEDIPRSGRLMLAGSALCLLLLTLIKAALLWLIFT